jgi:hypothetical protein
MLSLAPVMVSAELLHAVLASLMIDMPLLSVVNSVNAVLSAAESF